MSTWDLVHTSISINMPKQKKKEEEMPVLSRIHIDISSGYRWLRKVHTVCSNMICAGGLNIYTRGTQGWIYSGAKIMDQVISLGQICFYSKCMFFLGLYIDWMVELQLVCKSTHNVSCGIFWLYFCPLGGSKALYIVTMLLYWEGNQQWIRQGR